MAEALGFLYTLLFSIWILFSGIIDSLFEAGGKELEKNGVRIEEKWAEEEELHKEQQESF